MLDSHTKPLKNDNDWTPSPQCSEDGDFEWFYRGFGHMLASRSAGLTLWKTVWRFLKKLGIKAPYDPAITLLGIYPEETKIERDTCIPLFFAALFTTSQNMEAT